MENGKQLTLRLFFDQVMIMLSLTDYGHCSFVNANGRVH
ncbi:hypothetical protein [Escherichia coli IS5]|nr:hypothetical protein [Escherichia coli IS5]